MQVKYRCGACNHRLSDPAAFHCPHCNANLYSVGRCKEEEIKKTNPAIIAGAFVGGTTLLILLVWLMFR